LEPIAVPSSIQEDRDRIGTFTKTAAAIMLKAVFFMMRDMGPEKKKNKKQGRMMNP
jgi:hypothetical protein